MLEAHVRFELSRWRGEGLAASVREEVDALFDWFAGVRVADLLPARETARKVRAVADSLEATDDLVELIADSLIAVRAALVDSDTVVSDVVDRRDLHALVDLVSRLDELRGRMIGAVTDNPAYHKLVAHVLYHGVKAFVLSENIVARRLPGAQSLIRLGQRGLQSAAPGLEVGVDRQLSRFVQYQIGDTLSESKRFLDQTLTGESAHEILDTVWKSLGPSGLAELAALIDEEDVGAVTREAAPLARGVLRSGLFGQLMEHAVEVVLTAYADRDTAELLDQLGVDRIQVARQLTDLAAPTVDHALSTGFLEERIRSRLTAFYQGEGEVHVRPC